MNVIQTTIPEVLIIEPKVYGDERGLFFESFNQRVFVEKTGVSKRFVQDNHSRSGTFCAACTTRSSSHRENWCVWWWERYSMWRSICAEVRQASVDGLVRCCPPRTSVWSGSPRDLLTVSWCGPHSPSFSTRLQVTMLPSTSAASSGAIRTSRSPGRSKENPGLRQKIRPASSYTTPRFSSNADPAYGKERSGGLGSFSGRSHPWVRSLHLAGTGWIWPTPIRSAG